MAHDQGTRGRDAADCAIRLERGADAEAIRIVHESSFPTPAEGRLVEELRRVGKLELSLVAECDGDIVGHIAFSPVTLERARGGLGLAPVAVKETHRRKGIAAALIRAGIQECERRGVTFLVVLGSPAYYGRFGFLPAQGWNLHDDYGGGEAFQAIEIRPGTIPSGGGRVHYAPEFEAFA